jgi:hypothetical protein
MTVAVAAFPIFPEVPPVETIIPQNRDTLCSTAVFASAIRPVPQ